MARTIKSYRPCMAGFVLIDDPRTWPDELATLVVDVASRTAHREFASDLHVSENDEELLEAALRDRPVRLFHCTRLLDHERDDVLIRGLLPATDELRAQKLQAAAGKGHLNPELLAMLEQHNVLNRQRPNRENLICAVSTRAGLDDEFGVAPLMELWGGELVNMDVPRDRQPPLRELGTPSIVVLDVPARFHPMWGWAPPAANLLVGTVFEIEDLGGNVHIRTGGHATPVAAVWQPGHLEYDEHPALPQR